MENIRKRINVKLINDSKEYLKYLKCYCSSSNKDGIDFK